MLETIAVVMLVIGVSFGINDVVETQPEPEVNEIVCYDLDGDGWVDPNCECVEE